MPDHAAVLQPVLRHVLHGLLEAEEAGSDPGPLGETDVLLQVGNAGRRGDRGQQLALEVAGQVDLLLRSQKAGRKASGGCGSATQVRTAAVRIGLLSSTPRSILFRSWAWSTRFLGMLIVETSESPGFIATGSLWIERRIEPVPHAAVVGHFHLGRRIEHETVADALVFRTFLVHAIQFASWDLAAVERLGVDRLDRHRSDHVPVAVDELPDASRLVERSR